MLGLQPVLIRAPAGCGKTQAIAERASALVHARTFSPHQRILAMTFSNRARDNISSRLRSTLGFTYFRYVYVTNFHGLAARLIKAHGELVGVCPDAVFPERGWRKRTFRELGIERSAIAPVEAALRSAKRSPLSDDQVMGVIEASGVQKAVAFERRLRDENRLDFDDLLRHAERLLHDDRLRRLYQRHFAAVFVDEVQDLTEQQFRIVSALGTSALTAVVDKAQGIYTFAGADVDKVLGALASCSPAVIEFSRSYRSAPRVLEAVNVLAKALGATSLKCANPESWESEGDVAIMRRAHPLEEADALLDHATRLLVDDPAGSIAIIVRSRRRTESIRLALSDREVDFEDWDESVHSPTVISVIRDAHREMRPSDDADLAGLEQTARLSIPPDDPELLDELIQGLEFIRAEVVRGASVDAAVNGLRRARPRDAPVGPGIHVLTGHSGKGQQFDRVFVVGLEKGHIPDFRAKTPSAIEEELRVLHVMASRARKTLVFTAIKRTQNQYGKWFMEEESDWLTLLDKIGPDEW